jgi:hypothetical protein
MPKVYSGGWGARRNFTMGRHCVRNSRQCARGLLRSPPVAPLPLFGWVAVEEIERWRPKVNLARPMFNSVPLASVAPALHLGEQALEATRQQNSSGKRTASTANAVDCRNGTDSAKWMSCRGATSIRRLLYRAPALAVV